MHYYKNPQSYSDAEFFRPDECLTEIILAKADHVRGAQKTPSILTRIAWLFEKPWRISSLLGFFDIFGALGGMFLGFLFGLYINASGTTINNYLAPISCYIMLVVSLIYFKKGYRHLKDRRPEEELRLVVTSCSWALFSAVALNFIFFKHIFYSRYVLIIGYFSSLALVLFFRFALRELLNIMWDYRLAQENVIIAGDAVNYIKWLINHLHIQRYRGFNILGYLAQSPPEGYINGMKYLGNFRELANISKKQRVNKVFFALQGYSDKRHSTLLSRLEECSALGIPTMIISHVFNDYFFSLTLDGYSGIFVLDRKKPGYSRPLYRLLKRPIDIIGSLLLLTISLPLWLPAAICIKVQDGGPIFFKHSLVGRDGKIFQALKFRTMVEKAQELLENNPELFEKFRKNYKLENDPRITWIGKFLRKYSLDELPQLVNILKGEMSLVGPRPVKAEECELFGEFRHERIKIKPGLTGFWQVNGRCTTSYQERVQMDKFYMYKCNLWMDLYILLKTPIAVIKTEGAH